jgi:hypothetical protein
MGKPTLLSSGTNNELNPWVSWYYQYGEALSSADIKSKKKSLLQYVNDYLQLITSKVGGYGAFKEYMVFPEFTPMGKVGRIHEYCFTACLRPKIEINITDQRPTVHLMINGIPTPAEGDPAPPSTYTMAGAGGVGGAKAAGTTVGSGGSGTPPPPPKPGG